MRSSVLSIVIASAVVLATQANATGEVDPRAAQQTRTVYITAVDGKGAAVADLTAADITVKEGGRDCQVVSVAAATAPMQITIVVDDGGTGAFQASLQQFLQALVKQARFSFVVLNPQPLWILEDSQDTAALGAALGRLGTRGKLRPDGDQLVEAIAEAASKLEQRKAERPVILTLTTSGESSQADVADGVLKKLQTSGAMLNAIYVSQAETGQVLGDGPKQSGGRGEPIGGVPGLAPAMAKVMDHLTRQYVIAYTLPAGTRPSDRLAVATKRKGVTILAPTRIPDRVR